MSLIPSVLLPRPKPKALDLPYDVKEATLRGRKDMLRDAPKRRLCARMERGDQWWWVNEKGLLSVQATVTSATGAGKPPHRMRNTYNMIRPLIEEKVSIATKRRPTYDCIPSTTDPRARAGAEIAKNVAVYGYDQWNMRRARMNAVKAAIAQGGDGFAMPYFDPNVGPYDLNAAGVIEGRGEIKILTFGGNECYWEPGVDFLQSPWHAIEQARPISQVKAIPGFVGVTLVADAKTSDIPHDRHASDDLVMVTEYLERPCVKWPDGRRIVSANGRVIVDYRLIDDASTDWWEPYPLVDTDGDAIDEPCIHRISYTVDPDSDRDLGLTWQLIDAQRSVTDCLNKMLEWKNRCLNPQMTAMVNSIVNRKTDIPGDILYFRGSQPPVWETPPNVPPALFQIYTTMLEAMRFIASYADIQADPNVAARTVGVVQQASQSRWDSFLGDLAEFDSRLMRHCLLLTARFYDTPRLLTIRGAFGPQLIQDFTGSHLMSQVNITVNSESLVPRSREDVQSWLTWVAQTFPGWLSPEQALTAMDTGDADRLIRSYQLDEEKINRIIQKIRDGTVMTMPTRHETDPATGLPLMAPADPDPVTGLPTGPPMPAEVPTYMPMRNVDNLDVWQKVIGDWCKTPDYEDLDPGLQEVAKQILAAIQTLKTQAQQMAVQAQNDQAQALGLSNAAKPTAVKGSPSLPGSGAAGQQNPS